MEGSIVIDNTNANISSEDVDFSKGKVYFGLLSSPRYALYGTVKKHLMNSLQIVYFQDSH